MSNTNTGGPAFPVAYGGGRIEGMTLRDYFAAKATDEDVKAMTEVFREVSPCGTLPTGWRSTCRYMHADAMLKARGA